MPHGYGSMGTVLHERCVRRPIYLGSGAKRTTFNCKANYLTEVFASVLCQCSCGAVIMRLVLERPLPIVSATWYRCIASTVVLCAPLLYTL